MKCQVTSKKTHKILISKEISYNSLKEICSGEKKKMNIGYVNERVTMFVENGSIKAWPLKDFIHAKLRSEMSHDWEVLYSFMKINNIEPNLLDCKVLQCITTFLIIR